MEGGRQGKVIPQYNNPSHDPNLVPNEQKDIATKRNQEFISKQKPMQPLAEFKVFPPSKPQTAQTQRPMEYPVMMADPYRYPPYPTYLHQMGAMPPQIPVIKQYIINSNDPTVNHTSLNMIYEDMFPTKNFSTSLTTIGERVTLYNFIRAMIFKNQDGGSNITFSKGKNSLLNFIKFTQLNPYSVGSSLNDNPYKSLPDDMLIYRSCYPIKAEAGNSVCAKDAVGMNIKIYKLTIGALMVNKQNNIKYHEYDIWREVAFNEYIREQIIKTKICPNFVVMYGYYICEKSMINFDQVDQIRGKAQSNEPFYIGAPSILSQKHPIANIPIIPRAPMSHQIMRQLTQQANVLPGQIMNQLPQQKPPQIPKNLTQPPIATIPKQPFLNVPHQPITNVPNKPSLRQLLGSRTMGDQVLELNMNAYNGAVLASMSESPTYSLFGWATKTYQDDGNIRRMVNVGFYSDDIWQSILFQIIAALYTLQLHGIVINGFSLANNVFIKDLNTPGTVTTFWKYKIDGIDYYIPNYGFVVLIDPYFQEIQPSMMTIIKTISEPSRKINSIIFKDSNHSLDKDDKKLKQLAFEVFVNNINGNIFDKTFVDNGGCKPSANIIKLLENIYNEASQKTNNSQKTNDNIGYYLSKYFRKYLNNRIGTVLSKQEGLGINQQGKNFSKGDIVVYDEQPGLFKFVMYIKTSQNNGIVILTKDAKSDDIVEKTVASGTVCEYSKLYTLAQKYKPNEANLDEGGLLETYVISE